MKEESAAAGAVVQAGMKECGVAASDVFGAGPAAAHPRQVRDQVVPGPDGYREIACATGYFVRVQHDPADAGVPFLGAEGDGVVVLPPGRVELDRPGFAAFGHVPGFLDETEQADGVAQP